jgi:hypothetical protein
VFHIFLLVREYVRGDPGFCLDHLSPSMSLFSFQYSDDITLDIISFALSSSLSLSSRYLYSVFVCTNIYTANRFDTEREKPPVRSTTATHCKHHLSLPLALSRDIDVVEQKNERTNISSIFSTNMATLALFLR